MRRLLSVSMLALACCFVMGCSGTNESTVSPTKPADSKAAEEKLNKNVEDSKVPAAIRDRVKGRGSTERTRPGQ